MDLRHDNRSLHLPQEIVACIALHLSLATDISSTPPVNRAFNIAGTDLVIPAVHNPPLTLFISPTPEEVEEVERARSFETLHRQTRTLLTVRTWLQIPASITIEDQQTDVGRESVKLVVAPSPSDYMYDPSISGKDRVEQTSRRKATCWGRVLEKSDQFCIVMQWHSRVHWNAFRNGREASALRDLLVKMVSGCVAASTSEEIPLPIQFKRKSPLFTSLCEKRAVYFRIDMTADRQAAIDAERRIGRYCGIESFLPLGSVQPGHSVVFWLRGRRRREGCLTKPLCIVFPDKLERGMTSRLPRESGADDLRPMSETGAGRIESRFARENRVGSGSMHCDFHMGPWYH